MSSSLNVNQISNKINDLFSFSANLKTRFLRGQLIKRAMRLGNLL